jgi:NTP pyrophosphatase (non-canonical NTP hydrolase)
MRLREYQLEAQKTDQVPGSRTDENRTGIMVPLLGLAGEAGTLLSEYKKWLREGTAYQIFKERVIEELGDILWYVSNIAAKEGLDLEAIAKENLKKAKSRWLPVAAAEPGRLRNFDEGFPAGEQLPSEFRIEVHEEACDAGAKVRLTLSGAALGNELTDNAYENDGYRYHDVFHLAYLAVLGWSPVMRQLMKRKRKSKPDVDRVEDGGRAIAIEEGISALVFDYAHDHAYLEGVNHVDYGILRMIKQLTRHLEVSESSEHQWQDAILQGFSVWRELQTAKSGIVVGNLASRTIKYERKT